MSMRACAGLDQLLGGVVCLRRLHLDGRRRLRLRGRSEDVIALSCLYGVLVTLSAQHALAFREQYPPRRRWDKRLLAAFSLSVCFDGPGPLVHFVRQMTCIRASCAT
jgi:hypothetical protein